VVFNCKIFTQNIGQMFENRHTWHGNLKGKQATLIQTLIQHSFKKLSPTKKKTYLTNIDPIIVPFWRDSRLAAMLHTKFSALTPYLNPTPTYPFLILAGTLKTYSVYSLRL
jgi:hypothetical protein